MINKAILTLILLMACFNMGKSENKINITIDGRSMSATLADNVATKALVEKLANGPITITMNNYGGFEKVGALPWSLPSADTQITTKPGDIMLYTSSNIVIFYGQNSWAYTPLGVLETSNSSEISNFVGNGSKQVTISIDNSANISDITIDRNTKDRVFALNGTEVTKRPLSPGLYIINNKKVIVK